MRKSEPYKMKIAKENLRKLHYERLELPDDVSHFLRIRLVSNFLRMRSDFLRDGVRFPEMSSRFLKKEGGSPPLFFEII